MYLCCVESLSSFRSSLDFLRFFKVTPNSGKSPYSDFDQISPKMKSREFSIFIFFPDAYTCTYVA